MKEKMSKSCIKVIIEETHCDEARVALVQCLETIEELHGVLKEFTEMFTDTKKYPDPETITTGLRIFLPKAQAALKRARGEA